MTYMHLSKLHNFNLVCIHVVGVYPHPHLLSCSILIKYLTCMNVFNKVTATLHIYSENK